MYALDPPIFLLGSIKIGHGSPPKLRVVDISHSNYNDHIESVNLILNEINTTLQLSGSRALAVVNFTSQRVLKYWKIEAL